MTLTGVLRAVVSALDEAGVPHMVAGSLASSLHGVARSTADIDLVIDANAAARHRFLAVLDRERFYVDDTEARSVAPGGQFNVVDTVSGWKVDLIQRRDRPFSAAEFERRAPADITGVRVHVASAEDTVLTKLEWAAISGSDRQFRDVADLLRVREADIDDDYLDRWAPELGVVEALADARRARWDAEEPQDPPAAEP
jgi:hypothetical protein